MKVPIPFTKPKRDWPVKVDDAPQALIDLIADAMIDFGPDGHCDGAEVIAALALQWVKNEEQPQ